MSDQPTNLKTLQLYWRYYMRHPWLFAGSLLTGPAYVLQNIVSPLFIAKALGQLAAHHSTSWHYVWFAGISLLAGIGMWYISDYFFSTRLDSSVLTEMYNDSFKHILAQDYEFFADSFTGSIVTQANRFAKSYELFHVTFFLNMLGQFCGVLVALGIMTVYSPTIGLSITCLWILSIATVCYLVIRRIPLRRAAVVKESQQTGELADAITNSMTIKTFASEPQEKVRYDKTNQERAHFIHISWRRAVRNNTAVQLLCAILQLALFAFGIHAIEAHTISIATYILFQVYILIIINNVSSTTLIARQIEGILGDSHEMILLFERTPAIQDPPQPLESKLRNGHIELQDISFDYSGQLGAKGLFQDLKLDIASGQRIGLVGPSGGGKTTITKLLLRFIDVQSGSITIDGQDIRMIKQNDLHDAIAYVPQEPLLFHRSLLENIAYGRPGATKAEVIMAAKRANADEFITSLPQGYNTLVGERGIKLSGGQRQRVAIARAMLKNAPILVLDEATSALDSESEKYIQVALWELMQGKTTVVIAHRLSTIQHLDRIVVLDNGVAVEDGTHKQLLKHKGLYAKLWNHQSGGFIEE